MKPPKKHIPARTLFHVGLNFRNDEWFDWIDEAPIEDCISNPTGDDTLISDTASALRKLLKGE